MGSAADGSAAPPSPEAGSPGASGSAGDGEVAQPAELARRVVARIVDTLVVGIPVSTAGQMLTPHPPGAVSWTVLIAFSVLSFGYELAQLALWGRTLGKRFAGLRVVDAAGTGRVPVRRLLLRTGVYTVPLALRPVPVLGLLAGAFWLANGAWVLRDALGQALHDRVAGTTVVRAR